MHIGVDLRREVGVGRLPCPRGRDLGKEAALKSNEGHPAVKDNERYRHARSASAWVAVTSQRAFLLGDAGDVKINLVAIAVAALGTLRKRGMVHVEGTAE